MVSPCCLLYIFKKEDEGPEAETDYSSVMTGKTLCSQIGIDWEAQKEKKVENKKT